MRRWVRALVARGIGSLAAWRAGLLSALAMLATAWALAAPADLARGLNWLQSQVGVDGTVAGQVSPGASLQATCEAATTLTQLATGSPQIAALLAALAQHAENAATEARGCLAQVRAALGQSAAEDLAQRRVAGQGYAAYAGQAVTSLLDTGWALRPQLLALNAADRQVLLAWLASVQQQDGGFPAAGRPDLLTTAAVLNGLRDEAARNAAAAAMATKAATWLLARRTSQGAWSDDVAVTAGVFEAVHPYTAGDPGVASGVEAFLLTRQAADGSWEGDARTTAVALRALALVSVDPQDPTQPASATLRGVATLAATGQPAAAATIEVASAGATPRTATADAQGRYLLRGLPAGSATLSASLGTAASPAVQVTLQGGGVTSYSPNLYAPGQTVPSQAGVRGQALVFGSQSPLASATVQAGALAGQSGADGRFALEVPAGGWAVVLSKSGFATQTLQIAAAGGSTVDLGQIFLRSLLTTSTLRGFVTNQAGQALPNATVAVTGGPTATSAANGGYALAGLSGFDFQLVASAPDHVSRTVMVRLTEPGDVTQNIVLPSLSASYLALGSLQLSSTSAGLRRDMTATAVVSNPSSGEARSNVSAVVTDSQGRRIATLAAVDAAGTPLGTITLAAGAQRQVVFRWNTGSFAPGHHGWQARLQVPDTATRNDPDGVVSATLHTPFEIVAETSITGSVSANPPVLRAGAATAVKLSALVQNSGNVPLPAQDYQLRVVDTRTGQATHTQSVSAEALPLAALKSLQFQDWTPAGGGNFRLELSSASTPGTVTSTLYVGDAGSAAFTVDRSIVPAGSQTVRATIHVTGQDAVSGPSSDPLAPLVQQALTTAVRRSDELAYNHYVTTDKAIGRCNLCHVQAQAVVGGERNLRHAPPLDPLARTTLLNGITQYLEPRGTIREGGSYDTIIAATLGLWATTKWHDQNAVLATNVRLATHLAGLVGAGPTHGTWAPDQDAAWWRTRMPLSALNLESMSRLKGVLASATTPPTYKQVRWLNPPLPTGDVGLIAGPDGTVYISSWPQRRALAMSPSGQFTELFNGLTVFSTRPLGDGRYIVGALEGIYLVETDGTKRRLNAMTAWDVQVYGSGYLVTPGNRPPGERSKLHLMDTAGNLTEFVSDPLLGDGPGRVIVQEDGALVLPTYYDERVLRYNADGTRRDIPMPITSGPPLGMSRHGDGHLLATDRGLYFLNKDWVAERWLFDTARAVASTPDGRVIVNHIEPHDLGRNLRLVEVQQVPYNVPSVLDNLEIAISRAADFAIGPNPQYYDANNNIDVAFRLYALHHARLHYAGTPRGAQLAAAMEPIAQILRARQRADGGWLWKEGAGFATSDPLVTAIVGLALDSLSPTSAAPEVRKTIEYLLAKQDADGLWRSVHPGDTGLATTPLLATSWVEILLPVLLERLSSFQTDLQITLPANVTLGNPSRAPTGSTPNTDGTTTHVWKLTDVTSAGQRFEFDLALNAMQVDEVRAVAQSASLVFRNSYVDGSVTAAITVPSVSVGTSLSATALTDKPSYTGSEQALLSVLATNLGTAARDAQARFTIVDGQGQVLEVLPLTPVLAVGPQGNQTFSVVWPTAGLPAGGYGLRAEVLSPADVVYAAGTASFTVTPGSAQVGGARISADRASYSAAQSVALTARVTNLTGNQLLDNLRAVTLVAGTGSQAAFSRTESVGQLAPGTQRQFSYSVAASTLAAGSYTATLQLLDAAGGLVAQSATVFSVLGADQTGVGLRGQLLASPSAPSLGQTVTFALQVTNSSTTPLADVPVQLRLVNPSTGAALTTLSAVVPALPAGESRALSFSWIASGSPGQLLVAAASALLGTQEVNLAQATLGLAGVAQLKVEPSQLSFTPVRTGETTSATLTVSSTGSLPAATLSFSLRGADATQFAIPQGGCTSLSSLPAGASCTFSVSYRPQTPGSHSGELVLGFAGGEPVVVALAAEARPVELGASVAADPGEVPVGQTAALSFSLSNPSSVTATASLTLSVQDAQGQPVGSWPIAASIAPNASYTGSQSFTPSASLARQTLTLALSQLSQLLATSSFVVTPAPVTVQVDLAAAIQRDARVLMLASCPGSQSSYGDGHERDGREERDDDDDERRQYRAESCEPEPDVPSCMADRTRAMGSLLQELGVPFKVVTSDAAFRHEMRCGSYNTYWISGGAAKLSHPLVKELREAVWRGDSLVMDGEHDDRNQLLHPVVGVKSRGKLGRTNLPMAVPAGSVFAEGSVQTLGRPGKFELTGGQRQASFTGSYGGTPAIVTHAHGAGRGLLFAFDLVGMVTQPGAAPQVRALVESGLTHVASGTPALTQGDTAAIGLRVSNQGTRPISLRLVATLPAGASHADALPEAAVQGQTVTWDLSLAAGSTQDITWRVRADQAGPLTLPVVLSSLPEGGGPAEPRASAQVQLTVLTGASLLQDVLPALNALRPAKASERSAKNKAVDAAKDAIASHQQGKFQEALESWSGSAQALLGITSVDIAPARTAVAWAMEATADALCEGLACLRGAVSLGSQASLGSTLNVGRSATNMCTAPAKGLTLALGVTNRRTGQALIDQQDKNLTLAASQASQKQVSAQVAGVVGDWLDALLTASWQGHLIELAQTSTQVVANSNVCQAGKLLAANRFTPHAASQGLFAQGGDEDGRNSGWEWALGPDTARASQSVTDQLAWRSGKTYNWTLQVKASGQASFTVKEGGRTVASGSLKDGSRLQLGNALRLAVRAAGDVGTARIAATLTEVDGQSVNVSLGTDAAGQDKSQAIYQPGMANGYSAEGTLRVTFSGHAPPAGTRLQMSVQGGSAACQ